MYVRYYHTVRFPVLRQLTGWIGGSNLDNKNLYKTTNGGLNWFFQTNPAAGNYYPQINDIKFFSNDSGWAVHGTPITGAIMFTSNGGSSGQTVMPTCIGRVTSCHRNCSLSIRNAS